jgi:preprotein translocase subunit SecB
MADAPQPSFQIEKLYVKDLSLEVPGAPQVFLEAQSPQLEIQVQHEAKGFAESLFEVVLTVTVTARVGDKTVFLAEAAQAGIFALRNVPEQDVEPLLAVGCPSILYPYAREAISDLVSRGGFPPVLLSPVSFEAVYAQRRQQGDGGGRIEVATQ